MSRVGWHPPRQVDNTDTQYMGTSIDHSVGVLDFLSVLCPSVYLCVSLSVYLPICLQSI